MSCYCTEKLSSWSCWRQFLHCLRSYNDKIVYCHGHRCTVHLLLVRVHCLQRLTLSGDEFMCHHGSPARLLGLSFTVSFLSTLSSLRSSVGWSVCYPIIVACLL